MSRHPQEILPLRRAVAGIAVLLAVVVATATPMRQAQALDNKPYDARLMRLAEILGSLHYLRELCGANDGQIWRKKMQEIVRSEGSSALRRAKLVKRFNKGYRSYRQNHRSCTDAARLAVAGFMTEGAEIADRLAARNR